MGDKSWIDAPCSWKTTSWQKGSLIEPGNMEAVLWQAEHSWHRLLGGSPLVERGLLGCFRAARAAGESSWSQLQRRWSDLRFHARLASNFSSEQGACVHSKVR